MLMSVNDCMAAWRCPRTGFPLVNEDGYLVAKGAGADNRYSLVGGLPVLINFSDSVLSEDQVLAANADSVIERKRHRGGMAFVKRLVSPQKEGTRRNVKRFIADLEARSGDMKVLIIGGGSIGQGMQPIYDHPKIKVFSFDIYATANVQAIADAHHIPLPDNYFDAVIIQAVLEHVLQPAQVVEEIWRVLKPSGLIYAETPFMQQVHEGAYDFTRFTESGHRYLFRRFKLLASGSNGGPGIQFMWAVDYLVRSLFRSPAAGKAAKLVFFWMQYLDRIIPPSYAEDGASGVFFYGEKTEAVLSPMEIIHHYQGAQRRH